MRARVNADGSYPTAATSSCTVPTLGPISRIDLPGSDGTSVNLASSYNRIFDKYRHAQYEDGSEMRHMIR